jgi:hypothetical protein
LRFQAVNRGFQFFENSVHDLGLKLLLERV